MALSGVGAVRINVGYSGGAAAGVSTAQNVTPHIPVWDVAGTPHEMRSLSATAAAGDTGFLELAAWESILLLTGNLVVDVGELPAQISALTCGADSFGDVTGKALTTLVCSNNPNIFGSIDGMPLETLRVINNPNLYGDFSGMALTFLQVVASTGLGGSIDDMPLDLVRVVGNGNINLSELPSSFPSSMRRISFTEGLTQQMVDWLLEAAAEVTTWTNESLVDLTGSLPAPSPAGAAFIPVIQANGATVNVN